MALEQWEVDLRNQLEKITVVTEKPIIEIKQNSKKSIDWSFYVIVFVFFFLSFVLILDFQTDFINKFLYSQKQVVTKPSVEKAGDDRLAEIIQKVTDHEKKLFLIGIVSNENSYIARNGLNRKDILIITDDWKLTKNPKYIVFSEEDRKYFEKIQKNQ